MTHDLILPQAQLSFGKAFFQHHVLLVAGGRPPQNEWLIQAAQGVPVWCVDQGIDYCYDSGIIPERLIGDGDSASDVGWAWGKALQIPIAIYPVEKDLTDLQLALQKVSSVYSKAMVVVTGVWGGRFDHTFSNVYSLVGCCEQLGISGCCAADENEALILLKGCDTLVIKMRRQADVISLLPLSDCSGVSIDGVHWPLTDVVLQQGLPYAISNRPIDFNRGITVAVENGLLGVYFCWNTHDLQK